MIGKRVDELNRVARERGRLREGPSATAPIDIDYAVITTPKFRPSHR